MSGIQAFDFSVDVIQVLIWQVDTAKDLIALVNKKQAWYDENQTQFWENWYRDVFDLRTCNDFGLAVWSKILCQPLVLGPLPDPDDTPIFGFDIPEHVNFDRGVFSNYGGSVGLTTEEKRIILRLKAFKLMSRCALPDINKALKILFEPFGGTAYVLDGLEMNIRVVFTFPIDVKLLGFIQYYDLIPRATGVKISYIVAGGEIFGFDDPFYMNFDRGYFPYLTE